MEVSKRIENKKKKKRENSSLLIPIFISLQHHKYLSRTNIKLALLISSSTPPIKLLKTSPPARLEPILQHATSLNVTTIPPAPFSTLAVNAVAWHLNSGIANERNSRNRHLNGERS
jgi:hypothetical protein